MINRCEACGVYRPDRRIDPAGPEAICPECGSRAPFVRLPLLLVGGASGAGKSTVCRALTGAVKDAVLLDIDILWAPHFDEPAAGYVPFFETWLRMAKNIGQSGRPVVLFGAGTGVPQNIEPRVERRYFGPTHYLALVCDDARLRTRLLTRPADREGNIEVQVGFNRWFREKGPHASPPVALLDTTKTAPAETAAAVREWIGACLDVGPAC